jgi:hypothetical protein
VEPVDHGRDTRADRLDPPEQVAQVHVLRPVVRPERAVHGDAVLVERPLRADAAERGLPGVPVGVDEPGQHDLARGVHDLGAGRGGRVDGGGDGGDPAVFDEDVAARKIADDRVHGDHHGAPQECFHDILPRS